MDPKYLRPGLEFAALRTIQECAELSKALTKAMQWGWANWNPTLPSDKQRLNYKTILSEISDVELALANLQHEFNLAFAKGAIQNDIRN